MRPAAWSRLLVRRQTHLTRLNRGFSRSLSEQDYVVSELKSRGLVAALTSTGLKEHLTQPTTIYCGLDPTAASLHVGNLLPLTTLLRLQAAGHQVIALIGGATGSIGDPSGRSTERNALPAEELAANVASITAQVQRIVLNANAYLDRNVDWKGKGVDRGERKDVMVLNNLEWTKEITLLDFLKTVGKMSRVNFMLAREAVKSRLESQAGISFTEFTYQLLQANDFSHLFREHGCTVQIGGSDQWGNIVAGIDLIRRQLAQERSPKEEAGRTADPEAEEKRAKALAKAERVVQAGKQETTETQPVKDEEPMRDPAYGLTLPLLTTKNGQKFGKSAGNAVGLDGSPIAFWQFWYRVEDHDVLAYLKMFTFLPLAQIDSIWARHTPNARDRLAQRALADAVTEMVHGEEGLQRAHKAREILYLTPPNLLKRADVLRVFEGDPHLIRVKWTDFHAMTVGKVLAHYGLVRSRNEGNQQMDEGAVWINHHQIKDKLAKIGKAMLVDKHILLFRVGRYKRLIFDIEPPEEWDRKAKTKVKQDKE